jgi:hypothetical protein
VLPEMSFSGMSGLLAHAWGPGKLT